MKNISVTLLLSSFLATTALGNSLDKALIQINEDLNPKALNDVGYEVEYRQETIGQVYTWINITKVKKLCQVQIVSYLKDNKIVSVSENKCGVGMVMDPESLFQIDCLSSTGNKCLNSLAKEVNTSVIKSQIAQKIKKLYVK